jgi:HPt (histidine-containing phosphotransfer) domain-containing protein
LLEAKIRTKTSSLVDALWQRKRPLMLQRLTVLDRAAEAAQNGGLGVALCEEAAGEAHKLAGSLGTFGFPRGTEIARELELGLEGGTIRPEHMKELTRQLRETLFPANSAY